MPDKLDVQTRVARPADANWIVDRHAVLYAESDGFDDTFREFVERVVTAYFIDEDPTRERGWVVKANGERLGSIFCDATDDPAIARLRLFFWSRRREDWDWVICCLPNASTSQELPAMKRSCSGRTRVIVRRAASMKNMALNAGARLRSKASGSK